MEIIIVVLITLLINGLCSAGLSVVAWLIVFVPFILMTFIVAMLLYIFGLHAILGPKVKQETQQQQKLEPEEKKINMVAWVPSGTSSPAYQS
jgi:predicted membrane protein